MKRHFAFLAAFAALMAPVANAAQLKPNIVIEVKLATQERKLASAMRTTLKELCSPGDEDLSGEYNLLTSPLMLAIYALGICAVVVVAMRIRRQKRVLS